MSDNLGLGKIIETEQKRDAIHVAIAPVLAAEKLVPGQDVGFVESGNLEKVGVSKSLIGIVDPFLKAIVFPGQRFWLFLYPNTVTSLRHEWTHPAFVGEEKAATALPQGTGPPARSVAWIMGFAEELGRDYEDLMEAAEKWREHGRYTSSGTSESYKNVDDSTWEEFWAHYEVVTGKSTAFLHCFANFVHALGGNS